MYLFVFLGGSLGSLLRELLSPWVPAFGPVTSTFAVNVVACFILGWLYAIRHQIHAHLLHLMAVGFCGGLSTFSTFTAEISDALVTGDVLRAVSAPVVEISVGVLAAALGEAIGRVTSLGGR